MLWLISFAWADSGCKERKPRINNEHLLFNCENVREIWNILCIVMNFEIKWKHIVIGFYHEDNIKVKTFNNLISFTALKLHKYKMLCRLENKQETSYNNHNYEFENKTEFLVQCSTIQ